MIYKMHFTSNGILRPSEIDSSSRPVQVYMENETDKDIRCTINSEGLGKDLIVEILDPGVKPGVKELGLYPIVTIKRLNPDALPEHFFEGVQIKSSFGSFGVNRTLSEGGKQLMKKLWSRTIPHLLTVLIAAETAHCSKSQEKPWLNTLKKDQLRKLKKHLAMQMGQKVHPAWES